MKYENVTMKGNANEFRFSLTKEGDRKLVVFGVNQVLLTNKLPI